VSEDPFNPLDPVTLQCPHPHHTRLRATAPVHFVEDLRVYFVSRHDLVSEIIRDHATFSSKFPKAVLPISREDLERMAEAEAEGLPRPATMITADGQVHTRYRRLVSKAFSPKAIGALEPVVRSITTKLIDTWIDAGRIEFVGQFAGPLPMEVIAKALNVPDERMPDFKRWSDDTVVTFGANPPVEERVRAIRSVNELQAFFAAAIEDRRAAPQDDLLTSLLEARIDDDDPDVTDTRPLDVPEIVSIVHQLLVGGNETTTKLLAEMARLLAEHPDHWQRIKRDPSTVAAVVEESLRIGSPAQAMWRIATRDVEVAGVAIPAGSRLVVSYASANRDEDLFADPETFDPDRANLNDHLGFGKGVHFCIGASLARLEARVAFEELGRRLESIDLPDTNDFPYNPSFLLRGLTRLDLDVVPAR
jgi:cytochrome P450